MNKLFIGLLIIAAGTGIYFLLNKKVRATEVAAINKELIIGKWKTVLYHPEADTAKPLYQ